ncbi:RpiB/LacA/LacB family sugar-phosphate isomerase [Patescibacteria group bacterium]|nr:RpiB/LacA/LacB family sugar-phosphate isomerase [Patescibacteria group bacterium]MBU4209926.1 RpiB/LacA/LacB family sugar-phosphate isomerase [Patescibacteria group bacterium]MBU4265472.1 RpiB/LacA/LacB family sugar-phosphate isomerase [Patescibacteria group bacterium]MBU4390522.1 RpiB/LacA/LacB family sugar-phosphate isomerase [Patescibacteria group bacterium]MBU4397018.1 RpiB/LacA/LacB family sugar-phosphate isomerase [Patescibacteria group bacterium]
MIYLGADHRGYKLKEVIKEWLEEWEVEYRDLGNDKYDKGDDYVGFALKVAGKVVIEKGIGILLCGSGVGVSIVANKVKGVRAALCTTEKQARKSREDEDANVLCLSAYSVDEKMNKKIVKMFLNTVFSSSERHIRRIGKIKKYELERS